jgi:BirA family biotin operon repressor/biotin-[acetyl-CoA-carboxylase] ligase
MTPMAEALEPTAILADLRTATLPRTVRCLGSVGSTMDVARELLGILPDVALPLLVTAEEQTAGRGRNGRRWEAPPGSALLLSLALRPTWLPPQRGVALVWMAATALCEAVEEAAGAPAALKWPNDLLLPRPHAGLAPLEAARAAAASGSLDGYAKAAGLLLELSLGAQGIDWAIIGCGINVAAAPPAGQVRFPATSLEAAAGRPVSRVALLRSLLARLDHWHGRLLAGDEESLFAAWRARIAGLGGPVRVEMAAGPLEGRAEGVDDTGALLIRDGAGALHAVSTGDVGLTP